MTHLALRGGDMGNLGYGELLLVAVVGLLLFGPNKIPELARSCGKAVNMFKKGMRESLEEEPKNPETK
jgi:sec-independent protein translocase protein TatA